MAEQNSADQQPAPDELSGHGDEGKQAEAAAEVSSPELDHLQHTIDDAKDAAKAALSDQPEV